MNPESNPDLLAQLIDEWQERLRRGERLDMEEYARKYPALADEIRQLLPGLAALENLKGDALDQTVAPTAGMTVVDGSALLDRMGDFRILREVGRGGMGVVYEAEQVSLGRRVALKVLPQKVILDLRQKRRFEREAKSAAKLHHTNIVPIFGVGEYEGMPYYVMQFIQGLGLDAVATEIKQMQDGAKPASPAAGDVPTVTRRDVSAVDVARSLMTGVFQGGADSDDDHEITPGQSRTSGGKKVPTAQTTLGSGTFAASSTSLSSSSHDSLKTRSRKQSYWESIAALGAQVADALEHAHSQGILHRDIKPSNLLLDTRGTVWVTDFGLAKASDHQDDLTHTGDILGTLRYMPPEAFEGKNDSRGDIYALGLTLYELLALRPAFGEKDRHLLIKQVTSSEPERLDRLNPSIPRDLVTIIHKAIDREPERRYQRARELADDLERFLSNEPILARQTGPWERALRWVRKKPAAAALVGVSAVASVAIAAAIMVLLYNSKLQDAKQTAELACSEAELARDAEVVQRQQAEQARQQAEQARQQAETERQNADIARTKEKQQRELADAARAEAEKLRAIAETDRENAILQRGLLAVLTQQWAEAAKDLGAYTKNHPNDLKALLGLARAQSRLGRTQDSIDTYTKAIDIARPDNNINSLVEGYTGRAEQHSGRGKYAEAIADYEQSFKLKPIQAEQTINYSRILYEAAAKWQTLEPAQLTGKGIVFQIMADGSIIVGGQPQQADSVTLETKTALAGIRAIRLELLANRPRDIEFDRDGKAVNANFMHGNVNLAEFIATVTAPNSAPRTITFKQAWSDYTNPYVYQIGGSVKHYSNVSAIIDGDPKTVWNIAGLQMRTSVAVFIPSEPISVPEGGKLTIQLQFPSGKDVYRQNALGRIRLSATSILPDPGFECAIHTNLLTGWMKLALARYYRGENAAALEAMTRVEKEGGDEAGRQFIRAIVNDKPEQKADSQAAFDKAIDILKRNAQNYMYTNDLTLRWLSVSAASQWIQREPENQIFRRHRADALSMIENWAEAIEDLDRLIKSSPQDYRLLLERGECFSRLAQIDKARADLVAAGRINAEETLAAIQQKLQNFNNNLNNNMVQGEPFTIIPYLEAALALEKGKPSEADYLARRGRIFAMMGRKEEAKADFARALELNANCAEALLERGGERLEAGERSAAIADFAAARKINQPAALIWHNQRLNLKQYEYNYGGNNSTNNTAELALIHLNEIIESETQPFNRANAMFRRSYVYRRENRWAEAAADISPMIELNPGVIYNLLERAECYAYAGEGAKAAADVTEALSRDRLQALQSIRFKLQNAENSRSWQVLAVYLDGCLAQKHPVNEELAFLRQRASARFELGQFATCLADCTRILSLQQNDAAATCLQSRALCGQADDLQFRGRRVEASELRKKARDILEKLLSAQPESDALALALAEVLLAETTRWEIIEPMQLKSTGGARLTVLPDGSVLAGGSNPAMDNYLIKSRLTESGIRAFRLQAMPDPSLPLNGPGRSLSGTFDLAEVSIRPTLPGSHPVEIDRFIASTSSDPKLSSQYTHIRDAFDGKRRTAWGFIQRSGPLLPQVHTVVFTTRTPIEVSKGKSDYMFTLACGDVTEPDWNLGRFRLAASTSEFAMHAEQIRMSQANAFVKLAAARSLLGDRAEALKLLAKVEGKPKTSDLASLILISWLRGEAQKPLVASFLKNRDSAPLPMPSLAAEVLQWAEVKPANAGKKALLLARTYDHLGDTRNAIIQYGRALEAEPDNRDCYLERGRLHNRLNDWKQAAADFQKAIELKPDDHYLWFTTAPLILWTGDGEWYQRHRDAMLQRFGQNMDVTISERTAKACALASVTPEEAKQLLELSQRAVGAGTGYAHWYLYAHAMTSYRAGNLETAIEFARKAMDPKLPQSSHYVAAGGRLIVALAQHKLGHKEDARRLLAEADEIISRDLPDMDDSHPDGNNHDLLICLMLQEEARTAIAPKDLKRAPRPRERLSLDGK